MNDNLEMARYRIGYLITDYDNNIVRNNIESFKCNNVIVNTYKSTINNSINSAFKLEWYSDRKNIEEYKILISTQNKYLKEIM